MRLLKSSDHSSNPVIQRETTKLRNTRIAVAQLAVVASLVCVQSSLALAADVVTLRCDYPALGERLPFYEKVIADDKGISVTVYTTNKSTNQLEYTKAYTDNSNADGKKSYYRINAAEIAWGSENNVLGSIWKFDFSVDRRTGISKQDVSYINKDGIHQQPTTTGTCKPDKPAVPLL